MAIGPTPPGTGVMAPATSATSAKATSPTILASPSSADTPLIPTSIMAASGLTQLRAPSQAGRPPQKRGRRAGIPPGGRALGMGNSDCRVLHQEQLRQRLADDVRQPPPRMGMSVQEDDGSGGLFIAGTTSTQSTSPGSHSVRLERCTPAMHGLVARCARLHLTRQHEIVRMLAESVELSLAKRTRPDRISSMSESLAAPRTSSDCSTLRYRRPSSPSTEVLRGFTRSDTI